MEPAGCIYIFLVTYIQFHCSTIFQTIIRTHTILTPSYSILHIRMHTTVCYYLNLYIAQCTSNTAKYTMFAKCEQSINFHSNGDAILHSSHFVCRTPSRHRHILLWLIGMISEFNFGWYAVHVYVAQQNWLTC